MRNSKTVISTRKNRGLMLNVILFISLVTACFGFLVFSRIPKAESTLRSLSIIINASRRCPLLSKERSERKAIIQQKLDENQDFLANISKSIGLQVTTSHELYDLSDYLSVVKEEGLPLPEWVHRIDREKLDSLAKIDEMRLYYTPTMIKLYSGVLIHDILSKMDKAAELKEGYNGRLSLYSAHSSTVQSLWRGLNVSQDMPRPDYGAAIIVELHEIKDKFRVKVLYKKSNLDENLSVLKIRGCGVGGPSEVDEMCDLDIFSSALQPTAIDDFDKACEIPK
nr:PREDICTED: lysosomal acid phosphatase-like isoform X3 [Bemisia tabaci]